MSETCGHELDLSGVAYQCERPPHPIDDGTPAPKAPYRHAAVIDAELAKGTEEEGEQGTADLVTWGEDEQGGAQEWGIAWGDVNHFRDPEHGTYRAHEDGRTAHGNAPYQCARGGLMTMQIETTTITPSVAAEMLEANTGNRLLSQRRVNSLAQCITDGQWYDDGSPYRIDWNGRVMDGQHRLAAIRQAGIAVKGIIIRGLDPESQMVMDTGRPRSFADHLRIKGEPNVANAAAATRLLLGYRTGAVAAGVWREIVAQTPQLWSFYQANRNAIQDALKGSQEVRRGLRIISSVAVVLWVVTDEIDSDDRLEFFAQLAKRSIPVPPVLQFIRLMDNRDRRVNSGTLEQRIQLALAIKTWNRFRAGDNSSQLLTFKRMENFPDPK